MKYTLAFLLFTLTLPTHIAALDSTHQCGGPNCSSGEESDSDEFEGEEWCCPNDDLPPIVRTPSQSSSLSSVSSGSNYISLQDRLTALEKTIEELQTKVAEHKGHIEDLATVVHDNAKTNEIVKAVFEKLGIESADTAEGFASRIEALERSQGIFDEGLTNVQAVFAVHEGSAIENGNTEEW